MRRPAPPRTDALAPPRSRSAGADVEQRTLTPVARDLDCDDYLMWSADSEQRAVVACPKPSMAENRFLPGERLHHYRWLELIDFSSRRRLRTDRVFEAELTETGIAVGIEPGPSARLAALDWPATCPP